MRTDPTPMQPDAAGRGIDPRNSATAEAPQLDLTSPPWQNARQKALLALHASFLLLIATGVFVAWGFWRQYQWHLRAVSILRTLGADIDWVLDAATWRHGGTTSASLSRAYLRVTDADLKHLEQLNHLESLNLSYCFQITDAGMPHLRGLKNLKSLFLGGDSSEHRQLMVRVSDAGIAHLQGLTNLEELSLEATGISDAGLARLAGMTRLESLNLARTGVTDAGLRHLKGLTRLHTLDLSSTRVSDAGLLQLRVLPQLQALYLNDSRVTAEGIEALSRACPALQIYSELNNAMNDTLGASADAQ